nr:MAG TPA: hypothetical protein [Caudoviricetes sp.]
MLPTRTVDAPNSEDRCRLSEAIILYHLRSSHTSRTVVLLWGCYFCTQI